MSRQRAAWQRLTAAMLLLCASVSSAPALAQSVSWQSWSFDYVASPPGGDFTGLNLSNVRYQGRTLIKKLSFPVMRVFYDNDVCGPYADRLGGTLQPIPWAGNELVAQREFTLNGRQWYEIGIRDQIGSYDIYQVYYLSADGIIDAHIYSKGLQCVVNHIHYPNWRIDFDLDGSASDQILRDTGGGFQVLTTEFDLGAATAAAHAWRAKDSVTGLYVDVLPGFTDFAIPDSTTVPVSAYANNTAFGRRYRANEDSGWTYGPNTQVPGNNGQNIDSQDVVFWYEAYLPHNAVEGENLWHSTGIRLVSSLTPPPPDTDGDGVADSEDNCTTLANANQRDTNGDGYGNLCDPDLNNNGTVDSQDATLLRANFGSTTYPDGDLNNNGSVDSQDATLLRARFGLAPGPSGLRP